MNLHRIAHYGFVLAVAAMTIWLANTGQTDAAYGWFMATVWAFLYGWEKDWGGNATEVA